MSASVPRADLTRLREKIARLETGGGARRPPPLAPGFPDVAAALPGGGLARGAVHEVMFPHAADGTLDGAATGFVLHLLARLAASAPGFVLWAGCRDDLFAPGVAAAGLDPGRLLSARAATMADVFWTVEEGLRCPDILAVAADAGPMDFALSRRLGLAAADSGVMLLLLQPAPRDQGVRRGILSPSVLPPSAALTRWHAACASGGHWRLDLLRCKGGRPRAWRADPVTGETWPPDTPSPAEGEADGQEQVEQAVCAA